jgi:cytochrome c oxidase subunit II
MVVLMKDGAAHRLLPGFIAVVLLLASQRPVVSLAASIQSDRAVTVTAERFSFTPSEIRMKADEAIEIRVRSEDTDHGFRILDTDVDVRIPKRGKGTATVTFRPTRTGRYVFECSHVCGAGHAYMRGTIVVTR